MLKLKLKSLATWCKELTPWKRPWCWERLKAGGEGDNRGWDGWMASPIRWTWVWVSSRSWWWTGRPCVLQSMGSQRVSHDWATEVNWGPRITGWKKVMWKTYLVHFGLYMSQKQPSILLHHWNLEKFPTIAVSIGDLSTFKILSPLFHPHLPPPLIFT